MQNNFIQGSYVGSGFEQVIKQVSGGPFAFKFITIDS